MMDYLRLFLLTTKASLRKHLTLGESVSIQVHSKMKKRGRPNDAVLNGNRGFKKSIQVVDFKTVGGYVHQFKGSSSSCPSIKMTSKLKLIPDIAPKEMGWTCKVVVVEKTSSRTSQKGNGTYQHLWLMDTKENKVQATIFAQNIKALENTLVPSKTYLISNAYVKNTDERFRSTCGHTQWTISGSTRIEESNEDHSPLVESCFQFTPFDELQNYIDADIEIAFVGVAVDIRPKRKITSNKNAEATVQDIVLVNERLQAIILTIWDNFIDHEGIEISDCLMKKPLIVGNHLKVTSFKVMSLSTKANSSILINPKFEKLAVLREWIQRNKDILTEIITQKTYDLPDTSTILPPPENKIINVKDISEFSLTRKPFWIKGQLELKTGSQSLWYMACDTCGWMSFAQLNEMYFCNYCKYMHARAIPRARCTVHITDNTGSISASLFGGVAEKFLQLPAETLMKDCVTDFINAHKLNRPTEDHFIYMKHGAFDPKTNQPRFDVIYILDDNCGPTKGSPLTSPYVPKTKNISLHTNAPNARRNLVLEEESIEQLKKQKMIASTVEKIIGDTPNTNVDPTEK